jgi:hypothetical protein
VTHPRTPQRRLKIRRREAVQRLICDMVGITEDLGRKPQDRDDQRAHVLMAVETRGNLAMAAPLRALDVCGLMV